MSFSTRTTRLARSISKGGSAGGQRLRLEVDAPEPHVQGAGSANTLSSVDIPSSGTVMQVWETLVSSGQNSVAAPPDTVQMVARTWWSHISVGTVPLAKYSV